MTKFKWFRNRFCWLHKEVTKWQALESNNVTKQRCHLLVTILTVIVWSDFDFTETSCWFHASLDSLYRSIFYENSSCLVYSLHLTCKKIYIIKDKYALSVPNANVILTVIFYHSRVEILDFFFIVCNQIIYRD